MSGPQINLKIILLLLIAKHNTRCNIDVILLVPHNNCVTNTYSKTDFFKLICEITLAAVFVYPNVCETAVRFSRRPDVLTFMAILLTRIKTLLSL